MNDVLFTLTVTVTLLSSYFNRDDELDEYLRRYRRFVLGQGRSAKTP